MRKLPVTLALSLSLVSIPSAEASCARIGGPHLLQAKVIACEDPAPLAKERIRKYDRFYHGTAPQREAGLALAIESMLSRQPARTVTLRVTRSQQLSDDPRHTEGVTWEPWTEIEKPEEKRYLILGEKDCNDLPIGEQKIFLEEFTCCDLMPPSDLACLLDLPALVEAPENR
jgi:hypothetical protein